MRAYLAAAGAAAIASLACGCVSVPANTAGSEGGSGSHSASPASTTRPALTGFGATLAQWNRAHTVDPSVPVKNSAYLPRLPGPDGTDTWAACHSRRRARHQLHAQRPAKLAPDGGGAGTAGVARRCTGTVVAHLRHLLTRPVRFRHPGGRPRGRPGQRGVRQCRDGQCQPDHRGTVQYVGRTVCRAGSTMLNSHQR